MVAYISNVFAVTEIISKKGITDIHTHSGTASLQTLMTKPIMTANPRAPLWNTSRAAHAVRV